TLDRERPEVRAAGWLYLVASHAGTVCLFAFFSTLAARTGSWDLGPMREQAGLAPLFWLALAGFGVKPGLFPLHIWLPSAHANAPSHVSAIMSGVAIKMGIYGIVRFSGWLPAPPSAGWVVTALGVVRAVLGVAFALGQHDLKRLLAYHSVENIGIILIGVGFAMLAAGKGGGPWGRLGLGAVAISGLPPLNGFVSEWLVYLGLFDAAGSRGATAFASVAAVVLLAMTGAMALACFTKVCGIAFLGAPRSEAAARAHEAGPLMLGPMLGLGALCAAIGLAPVVFWPAGARAASAWSPAWDAVDAPPASLSAIGASNLVLAVAGAAAALLLWRRVAKSVVRRALTWDCGYAPPTARMQYTAGSFAATITEWFAWILDPRIERDVPEEAFPRRASFREHTPEVVLERVIEPAGALAMRVAAQARRLQHGRLQAYLFYIVVGLAALAAVAY